MAVRHWSGGALCLAALVLPLLFLLVAADFQSCMSANASAATVRTAASPDFALYASRGIYISPTPQFVVSVYSANDVVQVVRCAAANALKICPRSGGHSFTGQSTCRDVLVDVRSLNSVFYNAATQQLTAGLGNNMGELFYSAVTASGGSRFIGVGLCPSVGSAGYLLGGGHNAYAGVTGITCEALASIDVVTGDGNLVTATPSSNSELFWASCGGGGGHFGIATSATLNTYDAADFNNHVLYHFTWPRAVAGQVLSQWVDYDQEGGRVWFRLEIRAGQSFISGYGVCWASSSTGDCLTRLSRAPFFNIPGRTQQLLFKGSRIAQFQAFIGPSGDWGNKVATVSDGEALLNKSYLESGIGVHRVYSSGYFKFPPSGKPPVSVWQAAANSCLDLDMNVVSYAMCIFNPWSGAEKFSTKPSAFAHHDMDAFTEFVGDFGSAGNTAGQNALQSSNSQFRNLLRPYFSGLYVNYPEFGLSQKDYEYLYWGQSLQRLSTLRSSLDRRDIMAQVQGLPMGTIACPASLSGSSPTPSTRRLQITGYDIGQLINMQVSWTMSPGCAINAALTTGARVTGTGSTWTALVDSPQPFVVTVTRSSGSGGPGTCALNTVSINGIACPGRV
jgi:FAD binding domain